LRIAGFTGSEVKPGAQTAKARTGERPRRLEIVPGDEFVPGYGQLAAAIQGN